jgi:hypothetical protein
MKSPMPWLFRALCCVMLLSALPAAAKTIPMRPLSRGEVQTACSRAGGASFGTHDDTSSYGCASRNGTVECSADGTCLGSVSDLMRMPSNSLDAVLGAGVSGQPIKVGPVNQRVTPLVQP